MFLYRSGASGPKVKNISVTFDRDDRQSLIALVIQSWVKHVSGTVPPPPAMRRGTKI